MADEPDALGSVGTRHRVRAQCGNAPVTRDRPILKRSELLGSSRREAARRPREWKCEEERTRKREKRECDTRGNETETLGGTMLCSGGNLRGVSVARYMKVELYTVGLVCAPSRALTCLRPLIPIVRAFLLLRACSCCCHAGRSAIGRVRGRAMLNGVALSNGVILGRI